MSIQPEYVVNSNVNLPPVQNIQSPLETSHAYSVNTVQSVGDYIVSEDLLAGQRVNGRMSNVRRFFCLFVTFDLLFTSLMWIICVMLNGEYILKALIEQVVHYNIHTSLFDIVLLAVIRFVLLILFYGFLYVNHWFVISLSTTLTCGLLIAKVLYYDWPHSPQPVFEVLLVLTSFILSWGETWFLDFRVLPQESHAARYMITAESERTPLIRSYVQGLQSSLYTESVSNFYSPLASPEGSLYQYDQEATANLYPQIKLTRENEENYIKLGRKTLQEAWDLYQKKDWKLQKQSQNDFVYSRVDAKGRKIFKVHAPMDISSNFLMEELYYKVSDLPKWNNTLKESHRIQIVDEHTDITYQISKDVAGGLVSSRDFVNLRHWEHIDNCYVIACIKTEHPSLPENKKIVRGENRVGCSIIEAIDKPNQCNFIWIVNTDLKIWLPNSVLNKEMPTMMLKYINDLRNHISNKKPQT